MPKKSKVTNIEDKQLEQIEAEALKQAEENKKARELAKREAELAFKEKYPMRNLRGGDLFAVLTILAKIDIKDDLVKMFAKNIEAKAQQNKAYVLSTLQDHKGDEATEINKKIKLIEESADTELRGAEIIGDIIGKIMANIETVRVDINHFLGGLLGMTADQVDELPIADYLDIIAHVAQADDLMAFFKRTSTLLG